MADPDDLEIPVWYKGKQKWITGVTKRTTCDDVVYAILCNYDNSGRLDVTEYEVWEQWRGVERPLRGRTKILKLWRTWGPMCNHVTLFIKRVECKYDSSSEVSHMRRPHRRSSRTVDREHTDRHRSHSERARERERKFRENERRKEEERKRRKARAASASPSRHTQKTSEPVTSNGDGPDGLQEQLVQSILEGEKVIQDQLTRIQEIDAQIEQYETRLHQLRISKKGKNYLQDAYLKDRNDESTSTSSSNDDYLISEHTKNLEVYVELCDNVFRVQERIMQQEDTIQELSRTILEESMRDTGDLDTGQEGLSQREHEETVRDIAEVQEELRRVTNVYGVQEYQLEVLNTTLRECEEQLVFRQKYIRDLTASVAEAEQAGSIVTSSVTRAVIGGSEHSNLQPPNNRIPQDIPSMRAGGAKHLEPYLTYATFYKKKDEFQDNHISNGDKCKADDSNSDTGLSSMHSDESPPVLETLV